jgi:hypothetical protein
VSEVSEAVCPHCSKPVNCPQYHTGFSNVGVMYCDIDGHLLLWSTYSPTYTAIVDKHPWMLNTEEKQRVEAALKDCPLGGRFSFDAVPRCFHCGGDLSGLVKDPMHFLMCEPNFDADRDNLWKEPILVMRSTEGNGGGSNPASLSSN